MKKKRAFTMVELIFVIVILGILAAVAVPKLNASREDAHKAKALSDLVTFRKDIESLYAAKGSFAEAPLVSNQWMKNYLDFHQITNVPFTAAETVNFHYYVDGKRCIGFRAKDNYYDAVVLSDRSALCQELITTSPAIESLLSGVKASDGKTPINSVKDDAAIINGALDQGGSLVRKYLDDGVHFD